MKTLISLKASTSNLRILSNFFDCFEDWDSLEHGMKMKGINSNVLLPEDFPFIQRNDRIEISFHDTESFEKFKDVVFINYPDSTISFKKINTNYAE